MRSESRTQMSRIFAIPTEPANYTLDLIENVYKPLGVEYAFMHGCSVAAKNAEEYKTVPQGLIGWMHFCIYILRNNDAIIINEYVGWRNSLLLLLNILFYHKPIAIESDTQLSVPLNPFKRLLKMAWLRLIFCRPYVYGFAGGSYVHKDLFRHYGMAENRIFLMPLVVDNSKYSKSRDCENRSFTFGYLGRLVGVKQVDEMLKAFSVTKSDARFLVVGSGDQIVSLKESYGDESGITFTGALFGDDKIKAIHKMDCLILYSSYEPWGLVVNEALAAGVPVIVSDKVGARFDLVNAVGDMGETGFVVSSENCEELTAAMERMMSDRKRHRQLRCNAIKRMEYWNYGLYRKQLESWIGKVAK